MSTTLAEGTVFARRYRVVRLIASGAMGAVHEVVHLETERRRALKVMHAHLFQSEEMRERFKREARIAAHIESEHIVDVFDAGVDEATGMPFLVMELLRGEELGQRLQRVGRLPPDEAVTYLYQAALALDRTHAASIVHRDLKPANLFLSQREDGSFLVKILDFGVAKLVAEGATAAGATRSLGTPLYMAPEQFQVGKKLTGAADIHALGIMAFTLLVGLPYWDPEANEAGDVIAFAMLAIRGPQEPPVQRARAMGVALPPGFDAWFARATAVDPAARFRRATEAVQALGEVFGIPVGGRRATFASSPSSPGLYASALAPGLNPSSPSSPGARQSAPSHPDLPPTLQRTESALGMTPSPEHSAGSPALRLAATSTGAAMGSLPPRPRRAPLIAGMAALGLGALVAAGVWLSVRSGGGEVPAVPEVAAASTATPEQATAAPAVGAPALAPSAAAREPGTALEPDAAASAAAPAAGAAALPTPVAVTAPTVSPAPSARVAAAPTASAPPAARPSKTATPAPRPVASARTSTPPKTPQSSLFGRY
ncbi:protein kinase domain-containing protein [Sorangium sp. So ce233]|uniref:serine/threonine-protein kinase n=1 Tax=Sorangium sp. So ce233 TaxID=3133290 RepID=UPI003F613C6F